MKTRGLIKKVVQILMVGIVVSLWCSGNIFATPISDAPSPYGVASHTTGEWQHLGQSWNSDDGVSWSIDGGITWSTTAALTVGEEVTFKFDMRRVAYGQHNYDQLKAWVDWNGNGVFDTEELIIAQKWNKGLTKQTATGWVHGKYYGYADDYFKAKYGGADANPLFQDLQEDFYATLTVSDDAVIGATWLRARVSCDHVSFENTTPYGNLWQGEVEDYGLTIKRVPEPTTMLLLGFGLVGLAGLRRKFRE